MRQTTFHRPFEIEAAPTFFNPPRNSPCIFHIRLRYRKDGDWQHFSLVHIPEAVQEYLAKGLVAGIYLVTLPTNGVASRALDELPNYVVLGVELTDGRRISSVPRAFHQQFCKWLVYAFLGIATGAALSATPLAWVGGLIAGGATHAVRTAWAFPRKPFWPPS